MKNKLIDFFGPGSTIGEVAALNNTERSATVTTEVPTTILWISSIHLKNLIADYSIVGDKIWEITAIEYTSYLLNQATPFEDLTQYQLRKKIASGKLLSFEDEASFELLPMQVGALIDGSIIEKSSVVESPILLKKGVQTLSRGSKIYLIDNLS